MCSPMPESGCGAEYALIVRRPGRGEAMSRDFDHDEFVVLDTRDLREAVQVAQTLGEHSTLLNVRLVQRKPAAVTPGICIPPMRRSIVSLVHDISLLGIADGIVLDMTGVPEVSITLLDEVVEGLAELGYIAAWQPRSRLEREVSYPPIAS